MPKLFTSSALLVLAGPLSPASSTGKSVDGSRENGEEEEPDEDHRVTLASPHPSRPLAGALRAVSRDGVFAEQGLVLQRVLVQVRVEPGSLELF